jgi:hypothetical protein
MQLLLTVFLAINVKNSSAVQHCNNLNQRLCCQSRDHSNQAGEHPNGHSSAASFQQQQRLGAFVAVLYLEGARQMRILKSQNRSQASRIHWEIIFLRIMRD